MLLYNKIKNTFINNSDFIEKEIHNIKIIYLESLCSADKINNFITKNLSLKNNGYLKDLLSGPNTKKITSYNEALNYLFNGYTLVFNNNCYAIETKGDLIRSISAPSAEPDVYGPKDSFNESIQINLGLIKRRIKTPDIKTINLSIGKYTKTNISIVYISSIAEEKNVIDIKNKLEKINIDGIIDAGNIRQLISKESRSPIPTTQITERPDKICQDLLEGKIAILVDNSPFVLSTPTFFVDFLNPNVDSYSKSINVNFLKLIRFLCLIITLFLPALYLALITFNQGSIPLKLVVNFAIQRQSVPIPSYIECIFILIISAILRESDIRFPSAYGSSISIVGALVLGDAAVNAGIVSPIMIIIIALTYVTSMIFTDIELINSFRFIRFFTIFFVCVLGLYGLYISIFFILIHLSSLNVLNKPFTYPLAPFDKVYIKKTILRSDKKNDKYRSKYLSNNIKKQGE